MPSLKWKGRGAVCVVSFHHAHRPPPAPRNPHHHSNLGDGAACPSRGSVSAERQPGNPSRSLPQWTLSPSASTANHRHRLKLPQMQRPFVLLKLIFVGEVAIVMVLRGRKMPTTPVFNMVNVSVYACAGWPNYPTSSKICRCNYRAPQ